MAKVNIEEQAKKYLKGNNVKEIHATADGFLFQHKPDAVAHGKTLEDKNVTTFKRSKEVAASKEAPAEPKGFLDQSVKNISEALPGKEDVAELEAYLAEEKAAEKPRTTAVEAIEARIAELTEEKE
mgnify:CR=1 FL=1